MEWHEINGDTDGINLKYGSYNQNKINIYSPMILLVKTLFARLVDNLTTAQIDCKMGSVIII